MTIAIARQLARAIGVTSESAIKVINESILEYVRVTQQSAATPVTGTPTPASKELIAVVVTTTSFALTIEDILYVADDTAGSTVTITLPNAATAAKYPRHIKKLGTTADVIIDGLSSDTIDGGLTATLTVQFECLTIVPDGTGWNIL